MDGDRIAVSCSCGARLLARRDRLGQLARCPKCGAEVAIELPQTVPPPLPTTTVSRVITDKTAAPRKISRTTIALIAVPLGCLVMLTAAILGVMLIWSSLPFGEAISVVKRTANRVAAEKAALESPEPIKSSAVPKDGRSDADLWVTIESVKIGRVKVPVFLSGKAIDSAEEYTAIDISVANRSAERKIEYRGSKAGLRSHALLKDDRGNSYRAMAVGIGGAEGQVDSTSIYPCKSIRDLYIFEPVIPTAKRIVLSIEGQAFDRAGTTVLSADINAHAKQ